MLVVAKCQTCGSAEAIRAARSGQIATLVLQADAAWSDSGPGPTQAMDPAPRHRPEAARIAAAARALAKPGAALLVGGAGLFGWRLCTLCTWPVRPTVASPSPMSSSAAFFSLPYVTVANMRSIGGAPSAAKLRLYSGTTFTCGGAPAGGGGARRRRGWTGGGSGGGGRGGGREGGGGEGSGGGGDGGAGGEGGGKWWPG